jgi:cytidyltransferase-like protein
MAKLAEEIEQIKAQDKTIVLCHGCFDLMHPGHIKHFQAAKEMGDVLIVTVTADIYVDKGPGRPVFNQDLRVSSIAALECVDFAAINIWPTAEQTRQDIQDSKRVESCKGSWLPNAVHPRSCLFIH